MKRHFYKLSAIFWTLGCLSGQTLTTANNDRTEMNLKGEVKSVESELYNLIPEKDTFRLGEKINGLSIDRNSLVEFNERGQLTSSKEFLSNGDVREETIYTYDKSDRLIHRKEIDNYGRGSFYDYNFSYNSVDSITKVVISNLDFKRIHQITRDEKNRITENKIIQSDTVIAIYTRRYDKNGNIIEENEYRKENVPVKIISRTFDQKNLKQTEQITKYNKWDTLSYEIKFTYDSNQNLMEEKEYDSDTVFIKTTNSYFEGGQLKETRTIPMGSFNSIIITQKFNKKGDLVEHSREPRDGTDKNIWTYKYNYDSNGNWIKKIEYKNETPLRMVKRSIEYYQ
ncbi:hypothetical protein HC174_16195 [Salinimicrobium sp. CDJ15-81-2]|nr:hypothetical protein [Salinimicrobium nanhaiense]